MHSLSYADKIKEYKNNIWQMLQERSESFGQAHSQLPSPIWTDEISLLKYAMNLSAEDFLNIRYHTSLITGVSIAAYWHIYPPSDPEEFAYFCGYKILTQGVPAEYWIGEPPMPKMPRPIGVTYKGKILNEDIVRYQSCVSNLYLMGALKPLLERNDKRSLIFEVGGGYGGLAHSLGNILFPKVTYIIMDLPEILLFSGGFLIVNNPEGNIYVYEKNTFTSHFLAHEIYNYDFVLLPNYVIKDLYALPEINLMINMQSFQEMTREQLYQYVEFGYTKLSGPIYSDNIDRHPFNYSLSPDTVTKILASRFILFPSIEIYEDLPDTKNPWFYRQYFGIGRDKGIRFPENTSTMKLRSNSVYNIEFRRDLPKTEQCDYIIHT